MFLRYLLHHCHWSYGNLRVVYKQNIYISIHRQFNAFPGLTLDILKMASWVHMGRTANIIIKDTIHIFASISKILRILLMGRRYRERCFQCYSSHQTISQTQVSKMKNFECCLSFHLISAFKTSFSAIASQYLINHFFTSFYQES